MNDFERMATAKAGGGNTIALFLGLFLLILAFFILLVSISSIENVKSKEVMNSLSSTFADLVTPVTDPTDFVSKKGEILAPEEFQKRITGVFSTDIAVDRIRIVQPGKVMRIDLQALELFEDGSAALRPGHEELIGRIVSSLKAHPNNVRFEMAFLIGSTETENAALPTTQTLPILRAGTFARTLIEHGAPVNAISSGIRDGATTDVTIHFYVRDEALARLDFETGEEAGDRLQYDEEETGGEPEEIPLPSNVIDLAPHDTDQVPASGSEGQ